MPLMSGTELCKRIKSDFNTCHIPVVLLTARTAIEQNIEGLRIGADDYITKPFNTSLLISRCNNLVNSRILLQEKFSKQPQAQAQLLATNPIDKEILDRAMAAPMLAWLVTPGSAIRPGVAWVMRTPMPPFCSTTAPEAVAVHWAVWGRWPPYSNG